MARPTLSTCAKRMRVSRRKLYAALRERGILDRHNHATSQYVREGYFVNDTGAYTVPGHDGMVRQYPRTTATEKGIFLLESIAIEMGKKGRVLVAEPAGQLPHQRRAGGGQDRLFGLEPTDTSEPDLSTPGVRRAARNRPPTV